MLEGNNKSVIIEKSNLRYMGKSLKVGDEIKMEESIAREWIQAGMALSAEKRPEHKRSVGPKNIKKEKTVKDQTIPDEIIGGDDYA
jgi:transcription elongation factor